MPRLRLRRRSLPNQSGQPPLTCRSMPRFCIQASRPATSLKPFIAGLDGLALPKPSASPASLSMIFSDLSFGPSLRMVVSRSGGTRWPWVSMIIQCSSCFGMLYPFVRESGDPVLLDRQTLIKVSPCRVHLFDDLELPGAIPFLQLAFADQSLLPRFMLLIPDQCLDVIALREPGKHPIPMHPNTLDQVVGRPNVERAISLTGKDIHVESHSRGPGSPLPRGRTEKLPITSMKLSHRALRLPCRRAAPP